MHITKHPSITKQIRQNIVSRHYRERIPSVRQLAKDFDTTVRTMTKALKPLIEEGILLPTARGTKICRTFLQRKKTGIVGIVFSAGQLRPTEEDTLLVELKKYAEKDAYQVEYLEISDQNIFRDINFWREHPAEGFIFVYSSYYRFLSRQLVLHDVPFVIGNWMPINYGVHWIDFNNEQMIFSLVEQIITHAQNHKIAFTFPGTVDTGKNWLRERWTAIAEHFELPKYGKDPVCYGKDLQAIAKYLLAQEVVPEIVIVNHNNPEILYNEFKKAGKKVQLVLREDKDSTLPAWTYPKAKYDKLAEKIWQVFNAVLKDQAGDPRNHMLKVNAKINFN